MRRKSIKRKGPAVSVGSRSFVENVKPHLSFRAKGRGVAGEGRASPPGGSAPYKALFGSGNDDIGLGSTYFWEANNE